MFSECFSLEEKNWVVNISYKTDTTSTHCFASSIEFFEDQCSVALALPGWHFCFNKNSKHGVFW